MNATQPKRVPASAAVPRELFVRSDLNGAVHLVQHVAVLSAGVIALYALGLDFSDPAYWIVVWAIGVPGVFVFAPAHECAHRTAFASTWMNQALGHVCGLALALPAGYFRAFHLEHHRFTQDPSRDPELAGGVPRTLRDYAWRLSGLPYWIDRALTTVRHAAGRVNEPYIAESARGAIVAEARAYLLVYAAVAAASVAADSTVALRYWVAPFVLAQPVLRAFLMAEHGGMPFVADMLRNSRTTASNRLVRQLAWNMPYHAEHHYQAAVPFHALAQLRQHLGEQAPAPSPGYAHFHRRWIAKLMRSRPGLPEG